MQVGDEVTYRSFDGTLIPAEVVGFTRSRDPILLLAGGTRLHGVRQSNGTSPGWFIA